MLVAPPRRASCPEGPDDSRSEARAKKAESRVVQRVCGSFRLRIAVERDQAARRAERIEYGATVAPAPEGAVHVHAFGPHGYELELGFSIVDAEKGGGSVISAVNKNIYALVHTGAIRLGLP